MNQETYFGNSEVFLSELTLQSVLEVYGDLDIEAIVRSGNIPQILINMFGDYIIKAKKDSHNVYISSSAASLSFIFNNKVYSEEDMIKIKGYSRGYLKNINVLGMSYTSKCNMFGGGVVTLLPACILIIDRDGNVMQNTSWYDMLVNRPNKFSLDQMKSSVYQYFKNKKTFLLTSGGVDTAVLITSLKSIKDIRYATYYFETTGGNNSPEDARRLLDTMCMEGSYQHVIYRTKCFDRVDKKIYEQDVDFDLMKRLKLTETKTYVASGQNSDSIIAPGFVKSDSFWSTYRNWGFIGGSKGMLVNTLLVFFRWNFSRICFKQLAILINFFFKLFSDIVIDYSARGFYFGLYNTVPFIYSNKNITQELIQSYENINKLFLNGIKEDNDSLVLLRLYSYSVYAMQNQRGVNTKGYRYILPFHSAQFIGYCLNRKFNISEIWSPKLAMIDFLRKEGLSKGFSFYRKNLKTDLNVKK